MERPDFNRREQDNDYPGYIRRITNGFLEMKYIGITEERPIEQENRLITALLDNGLDLIHLRKPKYSGEKTEQLLLSIPPRYYARIGGKIPACRCSSQWKESALPTSVERLYPHPIPLLPFHRGTGGRTTIRLSVFKPHLRQHIEKGIPFRILARTTD